MERQSLTAIRRSTNQLIVFHNIRVWDTGEIIDLTVPGRDTQRFFQQTQTFRTEQNTETRSDAQTDPVVHIDASGLTIAPGFYDPHVHFRDPGQTYKETMISGCAAAASGGYTSVLIMPNTVPAMDGSSVKTDEPGALEMLQAGYGNALQYVQHYEEAHDIALPCRYDVTVCASQRREGLYATEPECWKDLIPGTVSSGKSGFSHPIRAISDDGNAVPNGLLEATLHHAQRAHLRFIEHCEHHDGGCMNEGITSRLLGVPGIAAETELAIVKRDILAAERSGVPVHFQHVSTALAFEAIREAKRSGIPITCETAPHYLSLCDEDVVEYGTMAKMNPPLRSREDKQATIAAVADGTVDMLATDHAPHMLMEKQQSLIEAPNGIIGLESAYAVCHTVLVDGGYIGEQRLIELLAYAPARLLGHTPTDIAGLLNISSRCATQRMLDLRAVEHPEQVDLVILNENEHWTITPENFYSTARNTPFAGWEVTGRTLATLIGSHLVFSRISENRMMKEEI